MAPADLVGESNAADPAARDEVMADLRSIPDESLLDAASDVGLCRSSVDGAKPHDAGTCMPKSRPTRSRYIFKTFAEMVNNAYYQ